MKIGAIGIRTKIIVGDAATWYLVKKYIDGKIIDLATDYETLNNKPKINDVELSGNKTSEDLGLVSSVEGKSLVDDLEIEKLAGIEENANNYTHPETHPSSIITQDANNRFVTDAEKTTWNAKASTDVATTSVEGLMSSSDKTKLDGIATGANNYTHPDTHPSSIIDVVDVVNGDVNKFLNERGEMVAVSHESLTDKNSEAAFQHVDTTTTKPALDDGDKVALYDSVTGKVVLSTALNDIETILASI